MSAVEQFTEDASQVGLRTLYFAMKILDEKEVQKFHFELNKVDQVLHKKEERLEAVYSELESNLTLLGATAVEDRLQDRVPEVIHDFQRAHIKVWMLTGDKFETAKNIGASCKLIQKNDVVYELRSEQDVENFCSNEGVRKNEQLIAQSQRRALVVQAEALGLIIGKEQYRQKFIRISKTCEAVICCRVSPKQKADVVRMIKLNDKSLLTMAVGDGNNDVSMINEAHVGVGLYGNEGLRAVQASDFAIPEFQKLWRLIFLHGRSRYDSISRFILYFFYKNVALTMPQYFYAYFCGFSAMTVFDEWYIQLYNIVFTAMPVILLGVFDCDVHPRLDGNVYSEYLPNLYYAGQNRMYFNVQQFLFNALKGMLHSALIFFVTFISFQDGGVLNQEKGYNTNLWTSSVCTFTALVVTVNLNLILRMKYMTVMHAAGFLFFSLTAYLTFMWASNYTDLSWTENAVLQAHYSFPFYLIMTCTVGACFFADLF